MPESAFSGQPITPGLVGEALTADSRRLLGPICWISHRHNLGLLQIVILCLSTSSSPLLIYGFLTTPMPSVEPSHCHSLHFDFGVPFVTFVSPALTILILFPAPLLEANHLLHSNCLEFFLCFGAAFAKCSCKCVVFILLLRFLDTVNCYYGKKEKEYR